MQVSTSSSLARLGSHREGEVLVKLRPYVSLASDFSSDYGMDLLETVPLGGSPDFLLNQPGQQFLHLKCPAGVTTEQALEELADDPRVAYAAPNSVYERDAVPNDLGDLYAMDKIQAPAAWNITTGSRSGPIVAVLDSGVDYLHPDLQANMWVNPGEIPGNHIDDDGNGVVDDVYGFDAARGSGDPMSKDHHGTHCAGVIGAVGNNGQGVVGVNWQARVMAINIFNGFGADAVFIAKALNYASQMGARIASCSFGGGIFNPVVYEAFKNSPMLHICAAGNNAKNVEEAPHYPASFELPNIVSVAATDNRDQLASYSNYGASSVDLAAPGSAIRSTVPGGGYEELSGTSMATPHVSGVATLIATAFPEASAAQIKARLLGGADPLPSLTGKVSTGGRLNAFRSLEDDQVSPGNLGSLTAAARGSRQLGLSWKATGDDGERGRASFYEFRYAEAPIVDGPAGPGQVSFAEASSVTLPAPQPAGARESLSLDLLPGAKPRRIYCALKAVDNVGNSSPMALAQGDLPAAALAFDSPAGSKESWTAEGNWGVVNLPGHGPVWTDSPFGDYQHKLDMSLTGKPFSLQGVRGGKLLFEGQYSIEREKDQLKIELSQDGGKSWNEVKNLDGDSPWKIHQVDLSKFDGQANLRLRFRLKTDQTGVRDGLSLGRAVVAS